MCASSVGTSPASKPRDLAATNTNPSAQKTSASSADISASPSPTPAASFEQRSASKLPQDLLEEYRNASHPHHYDGRNTFCAFQYTSPAEAVGALDVFFQQHPPSSTQSQDKENFIWICASNKSVRNKVDEEKAKIALTKAYHEMDELKLALANIDTNNNIPIRGNLTQGWSKHQRKTGLIQRFEKELLPTLAKEGGLVTGKWMLFKPSQSVDQVALDLAKSIINGPLSRLTKAQVHTLKVACCDQTRNGEHLIALFYDNIWDKEASCNVVKCIIEHHGQLGLTAKSDLWSVLGITSKHWSTISSTLYNCDSLLTRDQQEDLLELYNQNKAISQASQKPASRSISPAAAKQHVGTSGHEGTPLPDSSRTGEALSLASCPPTPSVEPSSSASQLPSCNVGSSTQGVTVALARPVQYQLTSPEGGSRVLSADHTRTSSATESESEQQGNAAGSETESEEEENRTAKRLRRASASSSGSDRLFFSAASSEASDTSPVTATLLISPAITSSSLRVRRFNRTSPASEERGWASPTGDRRQRQLAIRKPVKVDYKCCKWTLLGTADLLDVNIGGWAVFDCPQEATRGTTLPDTYYAKYILEQEAKSHAKDVNHPQNIPSEDTSSLQKATDSSATGCLQDDSFSSLSRSHVAPIHCPLPDVYKEIYDGLRSESRHYARITKRVVLLTMAEAYVDFCKKTETALPITGDPLDAVRNRQAQKRGARERETSPDSTTSSIQMTRRRQYRPRKIRIVESEESQPSVNATSDQEKSGPSIESPCGSRDGLTQRAFLSPDPPLSLRQGLGEVGTGIATDSAILPPEEQSGLPDPSVTPVHASGIAITRGRSAEAVDMVSTTVSIPEQALVDPNQTGARSSRGTAPGTSTANSASMSECAVDGTRLTSKTAGKRRQMDEDSSAEGVERPLQWDMSGLNQNWNVMDPRTVPSPTRLSHNTQAKDSIEKEKTAGPSHAQAESVGSEEVPGRNNVRTDVQPTGGSQMKVEDSASSPKREGDLDNEQQENVLQAQQVHQEDGQPQATSMRSSHRNNQIESPQPPTRSSRRMDAAPMNWDLSNLPQGQKMTTLTSGSGDVKFIDKKPPSHTSHMEDVKVSPTSPGPSPLPSPSPSPPPTNRFVPRPSQGCLRRSTLHPQSRSSTTHALPLPPRASRDVVSTDSSSTSTSTSRAFGPIGPQAPASQRLPRASRRREIPWTHQRGSGTSINDAIVLDDDDDED